MYHLQIQCRTALADAVRASGCTPALGGQSGDVEGIAAVTPIYFELSVVLEIRHPVVVIRDVGVVKHHVCKAPLANAARVGNVGTKSEWLSFHHVRLRLNQDVIRIRPPHGRAASERAAQSAPQPSSAPPPRQSGHQDPPPGL